MIAALGLAAGPAGADPDQPNGRHDRTYVDRDAGIVVIEASYDGTYRRNGGGSNGGIQPLASTSGSAGGMSWTFRNVISTTVDNTQIHHYYAYSNRTAGSGAYWTHVHAALGKWQNGSWNTLWSAFNDTASCLADVSTTNGNSETCRTSPWFSTGSSGQQWLGASGHFFDVGNNGSNEGSCSGCIDLHWTRP